MYERGLENLLFLVFVNIVGIQNVSSALELETLLQFFRELCNGLKLLPQRSS